MAKETEEMKHSPLPWKKNEVDVRGRIPVHDGQNVCIALVEFLGTVGNRIETRKANAEFIVHCVNNHDTVVDALEEIEMGEGPFARDQLKHAENTIESMKQIARAALAEVKP